MTCTKSWKRTCTGQPAGATGPGRWSHPRRPHTQGRLGQQDASGQIALAPYLSDSTTQILSPSPDIIPGGGGRRPWGKSFSVTGHGWSSLKRASLGRDQPFHLWH